MCIRDRLYLLLGLRQLLLCRGDLLLIFRFLLHQQEHALVIFLLAFAQFPLTRFYLLAGILQLRLCLSQLLLGLSLSLIHISDFPAISNGIGPLPAQ